MAITIRELIENPHLKTTLIAGNRGIDREITWAHSCELIDPTPWLGGGELIMTNGLAIPALMDDQVTYLQRLIHKNASGLAIGKDLHAPTLTNEFLSAATESGFPVLLTDYDVPWIALAKTVAVANSNQDYARIVQLLRLYEVVRTSIHHTPPLDFIQILCEIIECKICVIDLVNQQPLLNTEKIFLKDIQDIDVNKISISLDLLKKHSAAGIVQIRVPTSRPTSLLISPAAETAPDNLILSHVATIIGLIVEKDTTFHERQRRLGAEIIVGLIERRLTNEVASILLKDHELTGTPLCIVACSAGEQPFEHSWLHLRLYAREIPHVLTLRENVLIILLPMTAKTISGLKLELSENVFLGISESYSCLSRIPEMYQEALWALRSAEILEKKVVYYNEGVTISPFLPNNRSEAKELVEKILGSLLKYDTENNSQLTKTLYIYLSENRSWKSSAEKLHIHKQTLVYRIGRIEQIIGRRIDDINNISELWLAIQAAIMLGLIPSL